MIEVALILAAVVIGTSALLAVAMRDDMADARADGHTVLSHREVIAGLFRR